MKHNILKWLSKVTGKHKFKVLILAVIQAVLGGSSVLYALLLRNTIDNATEKNQSGFLLSFGAVIGLVLVQILLRAVVRWLEELSRATIENIFKSRLFEVLLKKDYASVTEVHSGEWQNRLTSDTQVTANGIVEIMPGILGIAVKMEKDNMVIHTPVHAHIKQRKGSPPPVMAVWEPWCMLLRIKGQQIPKRNGKP